jgi:hypothetical protein
MTGVHTTRVSLVKQRPVGFREGSGNRAVGVRRPKDAMTGVFMLTSIVALLHVLVGATNE